MKRGLRTRCLVVLASAAGAFGMLLSGGCAQEPSSESAGWVEPGWMAQIRQQREEYNSALAECYRDNSVTPTISIGSFVAADTPAGMEQMVEEVATMCGAAIPLPPLLKPTFNSETYHRMLDIRNCLINEGHDVPEPPSEEAWLEEANGGQLPWAPYVAAFWDPHTGPMLTTAEMAALNQVCPQTNESALAEATNDPYFPE